MEGVNQGSAIEMSDADRFVFVVNCFALKIIMPHPIR